MHCVVTVVPGNLLIFKSAVIRSTILLFISISTIFHIYGLPLYKKISQPFFCATTQKPTEKQSPILLPPPPANLFQQKAPIRLACLYFIHTLLRQLKMNKTKAFTLPLSTLNINQAARVINQNFKAYYLLILAI